MSERFPDDAEVARRLAETRGAVLDATRRVRSPRHSTRVRVAGLLAATGTVVALTAGTVVVVTASDDDISANVDCYETADLDSPIVRVALSPTELDEGKQPDPVALCVEMWRQGVLGQAPDATPDADSNFPVPALAGCELRNGVGAAFPLGTHATARDLCEALGLGEWDSD